MKTNWKKLIQECGFSEMSCIKRVREEKLTEPNGRLYDTVAVYLEKKYPAGKMKCKCIVDMALLNCNKEPATTLFGEVFLTLKEMDFTASRRDEQILK